MKGQLFKRYNELLTGGIIALFAILYLAGSSFIRKSKAVSIGAEFIPRIYGFVLLFLAVCLIYQGIKAARAYEADQTEVKEQKDTKNVLLTFALIIVYVAAMQFLGFMLSSTIFLVLMSKVLTPVNTKPNYTALVIYSVVLSVGTYYLFHNVMFISLPTGIIFGG